MVFRSMAWQSWTNWPTELSSSATPGWPCGSRMIGGTTKPLPRLLKLPLLPRFETSVVMEAWEDPSEDA
jgi:hypothetical protein